MTSVSDPGIPPQAWQVSDMKAALADRNIGAVYRVLQRHGVSQRRIAALTQQSQSEISEIIAGRQVRSVEVLARICDGLGIPRAQLGVASDPTTAATTSPSERTRCPRCAAQPAAEGRLVLSHAEMELLRKLLNLGLRSAAPPHWFNLNTITVWTGVAARALREAYRHSLSEFAAKLGVSRRTVAKWEAGAHNLRPSTGSQGLLDTMLKLAPPEVRSRFLAALGPTPDGAGPRGTARWEQPKSPLAFSVKPTRRESRKP
jgi:transcriptional regulator with XRE-family HTH domain